MKVSHHCQRRFFLDWKILNHSDKTRWVLEYWSMNDESSWAWRGVCTRRLSRGRHGLWTLWKIFMNWVSGNTKYFDGQDICLNLGERAQGRFFMKNRTDDSARDRSYKWKNWASVRGKMRGYMHDWSRLNGLRHRSRTLFGSY